MRKDPPSPREPPPRDLPAATDQPNPPPTPRPCTSTSRGRRPPSTSPTVTGCRVDDAGARRRETNKQRRERVGFLERETNKQRRERERERERMSGFSFGSSSSSASSLFGPIAARRRHSRCHPSDQAKLTEDARACGDFRAPFVYGCRNLGEAPRRVREGAAMGEEGGRSRAVDEQQMGNRETKDSLPWVGRTVNQVWFTVQRSSGSHCLD